MYYRLWGMVTLLLFVPGILTAASYTVVPLVIDENAEPRDILNHEITLSNTSNHVVSVFPVVFEVAVSEEGGLRDFVAPSMSDRSNTVTSWIEVPRGELNLPIGGVKTLPVTLRINHNAAPGEYHALIGFGSGRTRNDAEKMVKDGKAPSTIVTIRIEEDDTEFIKLETFKVDRFVTVIENDAVSYVLSNPGDVPIVPEGEVIFYDSRGEEVASVNANPDNVTLAPNEKIELVVDAPSDGLVGRYKAMLNVQYGTEQIASVYDTVYFYVVPWRQLLVLFLMFLIGAVIVTLYLRRRGTVQANVYDTHELDFYITNTKSDSKEHDVDLKQKNEPRP